MPTCCGDGISGRRPSRSSSEGQRPGLRATSPLSFSWHHPAQRASRLQRTFSFHVSFSIWGRLCALVSVGTRSDRKTMRERKENERKENAIHLPFPPYSFLPSSFLPFFFSPIFLSKVHGPRARRAEASAKTEIRLRAGNAARIAIGGRGVLRRSMPRKHGKKAHYDALFESNDGFNNHQNEWVLGGAWPWANESHGRWAGQKLRTPARQNSSRHCQIAKSTADSNAGVR